MKKICMIIPECLVKGGIAAVVNGYRGSELEKLFEITYIESYRDGGKVAKLIKGISGYLHFAKELLLNKPELVHIHSSFGPSFYRKMPFIIMASWAKIPIINHIHGADFDEFYVKASDRKKKLIKRIYGKCNAVIALSDEWKERLQQIVPAQSIKVLENYSVIHEDAYFEKQVRKCNNNVLFLGELGHRKGCFDIPQVVSLVAKEIPDVKFVLCGAGTARDEQEIHELINEKGIGERVEFPGWVRDERKDKVLREADVFFLPSYNEGMPMSVLDAMGYGLPIVSTNVGGIPKIVHHGENGGCLQPGETEGFAREIVVLLKDDNARKIAGEASLNIVKKGYSLDAHIKLLEKVYRSL